MANKEISKRVSIYFVSLKL